MKRHESSRIYSLLSTNQGRYLILLALAIGTIPFNLHLNIWLVGLFVLNAIFSARKADFETDRSINRLYLGLAVFFALHFLSLLYTDNLGEGLAKIDTKMNLILVPLAFFLGLNKLSLGQMNLVKRVFLLSILVATVANCLERMIAVAITGDMKEFIGFKFQAMWMHRGYFSALIVIAMLLWWEDKRFLPKLRTFSMVLFPFILLLMQARMNVFGLCMVAVIYFFSEAMRSLSKQRIALIGIGVVLLVAFMAFTPKSYNRFKEPLKTSYDFQGGENDFTGLTLRLAIWDNAFQTLGVDNSWLTGYGVGDGQSELYNHYVSTNFYEGIKNNFVCHNQFLESALSIGILGSIILIGIFSLMIRTSIKIRAPFLTMVVLSFFVTLMTESVLNRYYGVIMLSLVILLHFKISITQKEQNIQRDCSPSPL